MSFLDIGCNAGFYTKWLQDFSPNAFGVDYSKSLLLDAKKEYPDIDFLQADGYDLPFRNEAFDGVICFGVINCVANWDNILLEIVRVLKPGGIALLETNTLFSFTERFVRSTSWFLKRKMTFKEAITGIKLPDYSSSHNEPRGYSIEDITRFLDAIGVKEIVVHSPAKYWLFLSIFLGVAFVKSRENQRVTNGLLYCSACRRSNGWMKLELGKHLKC